jgi:hypothetical protein
LPKVAETLENTGEIIVILKGAACHQAAPKRCRCEKPRSFNDFWAFLHPFLEA